MARRSRSNWNEDRYESTSSIGQHTPRSTGIRAALRRQQQEAAIRAQHGPVKVLFRNGQPCSDVIAVDPDYVPNPLFPSTMKRH